jgi:hypothetical protein
MTNLSDPPEFQRTTSEKVTVRLTRHGLSIRTEDDYTGDGRINQVSVESLDKRSCVSHHKVDYFNDGSIDNVFHRKHDKVAGNHCARYLLVRQKFRL